MTTVSRTIRLPNGQEAVLSSDELQASDLILAEVLLEFAAETGKQGFTDDDFDEIERRIIAKGYDPQTYEPIN